MKINKDKIISIIMFILTISIGIVIIHYVTPAIDESIKNPKPVDIISLIFNSIMVSFLLSIIVILIMSIPSRHDYDYLHR